MDDARVAQIRAVLPSLSPDGVLEVARALEGIIAALRPERIYAFGSRARGDSDDGSDLDIFVVVPRSDVPGYQLAQMAYAAMGSRSLPIDVIVATQEEFDRRARARSSLPATVLREGRLLYAA